MCLKSSAYLLNSCGRNFWIPLGVSTSHNEVCYYYQNKGLTGPGDNIMTTLFQGASITLNRYEKFEIDTTKETKKNNLFDTK